MIHRLRCRYLIDFISCRSLRIIAEFLYYFFVIYCSSLTIVQTFIFIYLLSFVINSIFCNSPIFGVFFLVTHGFRLAPQNWAEPRLKQLETWKHYKGQTSLETSQRTPEENMLKAHAWVDAGCPSGKSRSDDPWLMLQRLVSLQR